MVRSHAVTHYFVEEPEGELKTKEVQEESASFLTGSSVFSFGKVDKGSELLSAVATVTGSVLDLGCGWGYVGISIKKRCPSCTVTLSDVNERAVMLAKKNAKKNKVSVRVIRSDGFAKLDSFDTILFNPPQHAGKVLCMRLIEEAYAHLNDGGSLQLVCRHQKGGKSFQKKLESYGEVTILGRQGGFRVYKCVKI